MVKFILAIIAFVALSAPVSAQVDRVAPVRPQSNDQIREAQREPQAVREEMIENRQRLMEDIRTNPSSSEALREKGLIELRRGESLRRLEGEKEQLRTRLEQARMVSQKKGEEAQEDFQAGLARITDVRKQQIISRIDSNLKAISARHQERFSTLLDKIAELLSRTESRAAKAAENGRDVSAVKARTDAAKAAIDAARAKVVDQAARTYTIIVTAEEKVSQNASATRDQLKSDLKVVQDAIKTAHAAVREVLVALGEIQGVDRLDGSTTTPPGTTSTTP